MITGQSRETSFQGWLVQGETGRCCVVLRGGKSGDRHSLHEEGEEDFCVEPGQDRFVEVVR